MEYRFQAGKLDPQVEKHIQKVASMNLAPPDSLTPAEIRERARVNIINNCLGKPDPVKQIQDLRISEPDRDIRLRIYTPEGNGPFPVVLFFHGGGWVACDLDTHDNICRVLCNRAKCLVASVDYRLSPDFKFPAGLEDAYSSLNWVSENISQYLGNPNQIGVCGESAGANIAAGLCLKARHEKGPEIVSQLLMNPITNLNEANTDSYQKFSEGYLLDRSAMQWFISQYLNSPEDGLNEYASPILCKDLTGLPPSCIITAEFDVLRDEAEAYAEALKKAGNRVTCVRYNGLIHGFYVRDGIYTNAASIFWEDLAKFQKALFEMKEVSLT